MRQTNQEQILVMIDKDQQLIYAFLETYTYRDNILTQKVLQEQLFDIFLEFYGNYGHNSR